MTVVPLRGEIWFAQMPQDPPGKGRRPVIVVSLDGRNRNERANTVLVIPLSTSIHRSGLPTNLLLTTGETGLAEDSIALAHEITALRKETLIEPRGALRRISNTRICELARMVELSMGCVRV